MEVAIRIAVMPRECFIIDAFATTEPFSGNPAAVVLDAEGLSDAEMQRIAAEFNLSETTFVLPDGTPDAGGAKERAVQFRWFTPTVEVDMCGHATVAGIHALVEAGRLSLSDAVHPLPISTRSGILRGTVEPIPGASDRRIIWLEMIPPTLTPFDKDFADLAASLRLGSDAFDAELPPVCTQDGDLIVFARDFLRLNEARPDFLRLTDVLRSRGLRGVCLSTIRTVTPSVHVQSRFFVPTCGINEDPVTGSVHGPLALYVASKGFAPSRNGVAAMTCVQGIPGGRTGMLHALVRAEPRDDLFVRIGGQARTTIRGTLMM